tara:strand:+ start:134 stop:691 length:558 start_codon:yes stop_codon:yes gene_type:complete
MAKKPPLMDYAGIYGNTSLNMPNMKRNTVPSDADTGVSMERNRPFKKLFGGLRDKLGSMFGRTRFDSSDFDVSDPNEVIKFQRMTGLDADGVFGPKTEMAYRKFVDQQRMDEGLDAYVYDDGTTFDASGDGMTVPSEEELAGMGSNPLYAAMDNESSSYEEEFPVSEENYMPMGPGSAISDIFSR